MSNIQNNLVVLKILIDHLDYESLENYQLKHPSWAIVYCSYCYNAQSEEFRTRFPSLRLLGNNKIANFYDTLRKFECSNCRNAVGANWLNYNRDVVGELTLLQDLDTDSKRDRLSFIMCLPIMDDSHLIKLVAQELLPEFPWDVII